MAHNAGDNVESELAVIMVDHIESGPAIRTCSEGHPHHTITGVALFCSGAPQSGGERVTYPMIFSPQGLMQMLADLLESYDLLDPANRDHAHPGDPDHDPTPEGREL